MAIDDYIRLRRAGFTQVYPIIERRLASADGALISIIATDLLALPLTTAGTDSEGENPFGSSGWSRLTQSPFEAWVPSQTAERLGVVEGEQIRLRDGTLLPRAAIRSQARRRAQH